MPVLCVTARGLADSGQDLGQCLDVPIGEDEDSRFISLDVSEFHKGLLVSSGIESDRDVLDPVLVDEEDVA